MNLPSPLISAAALKERLALSNEQVVVMDASMHLPTANRDAWQEHQDGHIPGAVFFDIDRIADVSSELPHMLPSAAEFSDAVAQLGVGADSTVVVYDSHGLFSAARVWWMFTVFGHDKVLLLDGGLPAWQAIGAELESGITQVGLAEKPIRAQLIKESVASLQTVLDAVNDADGGARILDARSKARFDAAAPEPRAGLRAGHMPGALSLPFTELLTTDNTDIIRLKPVDEIKAVFDAHGVQPTDTVIASCGSGVTAAVLTLGLQLAGFKSGRLYDGSWVEWGSRSDTPIET